MTISVFDLYSVGIGPSSSHTIGPMKAAKLFVNELSLKQLFDQTEKLQCYLYGSLALTGYGHGTPNAVLSGFEGNEPETVDPKSVPKGGDRIAETSQLLLGGKRSIAFDVKQDMLIELNTELPKHPNGLRFIAKNAKGKRLLESVYYSIGGGFIVKEEDFGLSQQTIEFPYPFTTAEELLRHCRNQQCTIADLMIKNERVAMSEKAIFEKLAKISAVMFTSIENGLKHRGLLPGVLQLKRRAPDMHRQLLHHGTPSPKRYKNMMGWVDLFAIAASEENAAGGRVVTAPTNGSAGIIPAVLSYYKHFTQGSSQEGIFDFLLTAGAIGILYKSRASISGAEVGCQGEVGVAASMAAAGLAAVRTGSLRQIENAAEIAMEHHLGMTCDPIAGLVQIPCIERNAMGALKAINASKLAMLGDGSHYVSLDKVIATMYQTGKDMMLKYRETALGGLAINLTEC